MKDKYGTVDTAMWVIEFSSGTFFQDLGATRGGPVITAQKFRTKHLAVEFMEAHSWIYFNGGMAIECQ